MQEWTINEEKPLNAFHRDKRLVGGHGGRCKDCKKSNWLKRNNNLDIMARRMVRKAIRSKSLPRPDLRTCEVKECNNQAVEYHHYAGYDKENWLTVMAVCRDCHGLAHRRIDPVDIEPEHASIA